MSSVGGEPIQICAVGRPNLVCVRGSSSEEKGWMGGVEDTNGVWSGVSLGMGNGARGMFTSAGCDTDAFILRSVRR
jgi:hypothetical protein